MRKTKTMRKATNLVRTNVSKITVSSKFPSKFPSKFLTTSRQFSCKRKLQSPTPLRNLVLKKELDKQTQKISNDSPEEDQIQKQIVDYDDSKKSIKSDLGKIELAQKAVEKMSNNETPSKKEFTAYSHLQSEYEEHLLSDSESDNESQSSFVKESKHEKLDNLKTYLVSEFKSISGSSKSLKKVFNKLATSQLSENEKKRKGEELSSLDSSLVVGQSKKSRQSVHEYVEQEVATDFSPFDDIGTD